MWDQDSFRCTLWGDNTSWRRCSIKQHKFDTHGRYGTHCRFKRSIERQFLIKGQLFRLKLSQTVSSPAVFMTQQSGHISKGRMSSFVGQDFRPLSAAQDPICIVAGGCITNVARIPETTDIYNKHQRKIWRSSEHLAMWVGRV